MERKYNEEKINWKTQGKEFWLPVLNMNHNERSNFLLTNGLQFKNYAWCKACNHPFWNCKCYDKAHQEKTDATTDLRKASFEDKLAHSRALVERVLKEHVGEQIFLAYSGGFDSECCFQLFKEAILDGRVQVAFSDTGCEYPDTYLRIKEVEAEYGIKIIKAHPPKGTTFKSVIAQYGMPLGSRGGDKATRTATSKCCGLLKKRPMHKLMKKADVCILGLNMENEYRKLNIYTHGDYFYATSHKQWRVLPIAFWTTEDKWRFQKEEGFKFNKLYTYTNCEKNGTYKLKRSNGKELTIRNGCWCCPQSIPLGSDEWLMDYYPKLYKFLVDKSGYGMLLYVVKKRNIRRFGGKPTDEKVDDAGCPPIVGM